ncbi:MAG: histidine kinase [Saprospiraceae bacterium]
MKIKYLLIILLVIAGFLPSQGQVLPIETKYYSQNDGLPNRTVYDVYTDSRGIMWVSTASGISRFDGVKFYNFSNIVFSNVAKKINIRGAGKINEDGQQNLIIQPTDYKDSLEVLNFQTLKSYGISLKKSQTLLGEFIDISIVSGGDIFLLRRSNTHLLIYKWQGKQDFELVEKIISTSSGNEKYDKIIALPNNEFWVFDYYQQKLIKLSEEKQKEFFPFKNSTNNRLEHLDIFHKNKNGRLWLSSTFSNDFFYIEKSETHIQAYEGRPNYNYSLVWEDELGNMIVSANEGFYSQRLILVNTKNEFTNLEKIRTLESKITSIRGKDFTKNFHLSSHNGFYQFTIGYENKNIRNYLNQELKGGQFGNVMRGFAGDKNGKIYAAEEGSYWYELNTKNDELEKIIVRDSLGKAVEKMSCGGNLIYEENYLWGVSCDQSTNGRIHRYHPETKTWSMWILPRKGVIPRTILEKSKDEFWVFTLHQTRRNGDIFIFNKRTGEFTSFDNWKEKKDALRNTIINFSEKDQDGIIWLATSTGLVKIDEEQNQFQKFLIDENSKNRKHILTLFNDDDEIWIGTLSEGIFFFNKKTEVFSEFFLHENTKSIHRKTNNVFPNNNISGILKVGEKEYLVSTFFGLTYLNMEENSSRNFYERDGFGNYEFNRLSHFKDENNNIYFGGINGFDVFRVEDLAVRKTHPAPVINRFFDLQEGLDLVRNQYGDFDFTKTLVIEPETVFFGFDFMLPNYINSENNTFQTYLEGWETDFNPPTNIPSVQYYRLPAGEYKLKVRGMDDRGNSSVKDLIIPIKVKPYFYRTWSFYSLAFLSVFGIGCYFVKRKIDRRKKVEQEEIAKKENQRRFLELELKTLRLQLNPHFMFNALGAIQFYIKNNESRLAINYLGDFAMLMRLFLESSKNKYVSIEDELKLLKLYVTLEQMRFENKFDVNYEIDESLDLVMTEIPSLLLQPFVENAINHGLRHKKSQGLLTIKMIFEQENDTLICIIEDDGIGRKKAAEIRAQSLKKHKSRGTQIIEERLATFNASGEIKLEVKTEDVNILASALEDCGTRVTLTIPNIE